MDMDTLQLRNLRDFLLLYNQISETCFIKCTNIFLSREITPAEELCISKCAQKHIHANHKVMETFMEVQPVMVRRRMEQINAAQATLEAEIQNQQMEQSPQ